MTSPAKCFRRSSPILTAPTPIMPLKPVRDLRDSTVRPISPGCLHRFPPLLQSWPPPDLENNFIFPAFVPTLKWAHEHTATFPDRHPHTTALIATKRRRTAFLCA